MPGEEYVVSYYDVRYLIENISRIKQYPIRITVLTASVSQRTKEGVPDTLHLDVSLEVYADDGKHTHIFQVNYFASNTNTIKQPHLEMMHMESMIDFIVHVYGEEGVQNILPENADYEPVPKEKLSEDSISIPKLQEFNMKHMGLYRKSNSIDAPK